MASTLILGSNKLALTMAKLLSSVGERVCLVDGNQGARDTLRNMLREEVEKDIPFQFVDDLRHQQAALEKRMDRVTFCKRASEADSNVRAVIATEEDSLTNTSFHGSTPVATMVSDAQWPTHVTVRLYQPIEQTKMAQVLVSAATDPTALFCIRALLEKMGIDEITREQADIADRMLKTTHNKPTLDDVIRTILPRRAPVDFTSTVMH